MKFLAGTIDAKGYKYVLAGNASPAVEATYLIQKAPPEDYDWGASGTDEAIGRLVDLVMARVVPNGSPRLRSRLMHYFRYKTHSDKMWLISHERLIKDVFSSLSPSSDKTM